MPWLSLCINLNTDVSLIHTCTRICQCQSTLTACLRERKPIALFDVTGGGKESSIDVMLLGNRGNLGDVIGSESIIHHPDPHDRMLDPSRLRPVLRDINLLLHPTVCSIITLHPQFRSNNHTLTFTYPTLPPQIPLSSCRTQETSSVATRPTSTTQVCSLFVVSHVLQRLSANEPFRHLRRVQAAFQGSPRQRVQWR